MGFDHNYIQVTYLSDMKLRLGHQRTLAGRYMRTVLLTGVLPLRTARKVRNIPHSKVHSHTVFSFVSLKNTIFTMHQNMTPYMPVKGRFQDGSRINN